MYNVTLTVNNNRYTGWKKVSVKRGIQNIADSFELTLTDKTPEAQQVRQVNQGDECKVYVENNLVITGYVDDVMPTYDDADHTISVTGRSKTADLVDCSAIHAEGEWQQQTLARIASDICAPFSISVLNFISADKFERVAIEEGESCFELLERLARQRGVLLNANNGGDLVITRAGQLRFEIPLIEGKNILKAKAKHSHRDRFSHYIGKGQHAGNDSFNGEAASTPSYELKDSAIRYRPLIIHAENNATIKSLQERVAWERTVRQARSTSATLTVQGWMNGDELWQPNRLIKVTSPALKLDHEVLISAVAYTKDETGTKALLDITHKNAFTPEPEIEETVSEDAWT